MSLSIVLFAGLAASIFVGFNIGGSSTGIAWGPAVGARILSKTAAAALMTFFVFLGGITVGRNVMDTLAGDIITIPITLEAGVGVLFFIGLGILIANIFGVPVPTSMTTVASIAGLGLATETLNYGTIGSIVSWWIVTPIIGFWIGAVIGRYVYPELDRRYAIEVSDGPLLSLDRSGRIPRPTYGPNTDRQEFVSTVVVLMIGCYMAFSAGASNVPSYLALVIAMVYVFLPFMVITLYTSIKDIDRSLIEASRDLGAGPIETFVRVTLPLSKNGIISGVILVFTLSLGIYVVPRILANPPEWTIAVLIGEQVGVEGNIPFGAAISVVILAVVCTILALGQYLTGDDAGVSGR